MLHNNFSCTQLAPFFHFQKDIYSVHSNNIAFWYFFYNIAFWYFFSRKILIAFTSTLMLCVFLFFRKILIPWVRLKEKVMKKIFNLFLETFKNVTLKSHKIIWNQIKWLFKDSIFEHGFVSKLWTFFRNIYNNEKLKTSKS